MNRIPDRMIIHEGFDAKTLDFDVCLLHFEQSFELEKDQRIDLACLANKGAARQTNLSENLSKYQS